MAKKRKLKCKHCGEEWLPADVPTKKEWNLISPMPDKDGNVTITRMATWDCPNCGKNKTGAMGKTKGEFKEEETPKYKLETALESGKKVDLASLSEETGYELKNLKKIIPAYQKKKNIKGKIEGDFFIPE